jgi:putative ABC transport system permease protein
MLSVYHTFSVRHLRMRWPRASLVAASIALGVAAWVATGILNNSLERSIQVAVTPMGGLADFYVSHGDYGVPVAVADRLRRVDGVSKVRPLVFGDGQVDLGDGKRRPILLLGFSFDEKSEDTVSEQGVKVDESAKERFAELYGIHLISLRRRPAPVLVGRQLAREMPRGQTDINLWVNAKPSRVALAGAVDAQGPLATLGGNVLITDADLAARLVGKPGRDTRLDVIVEKGRNREQVQERVRLELAEGAGGPVPAEVRLPQENERRVQDVLLGIKIGFYLCGAGSLVVGMFLVYNALSVSVAERTHDIGILRALGATRGQVAALFLGEAALLGLAGALAGLPLGLGLGKLALGPMQQVLSDIFLPLPAREMEIGVGNLVTACIAGMVTALIAAAIPAVRATAQAPAESVRRVPPRWHWRFRLVHAGSSALLLALGAAGAVFREWLPYRLGVYGGVALIFIGCLLASPLLAAACARFLRPAARLLGIEGRLAADNLVRTPGRTGLVIAALAASVALLVQTAGVIRSNEDSILTAIDRTVTADLILTAGGPISTSGQVIPMKDEVGAKVEDEFPRTKVVPLCFRPLDWERDGRPTRVMLVGFDAGLYYEINKQRDNPVPNLHLFRQLADQGATAVVSDNFAELYHVKAGDWITVPGLNGPVSMRVLGSFEDYTWNRGTIFVHRAHFMEPLDLHLVDAFDLYLPAGADPAAARDRIQKSEWGTQYALFALTRDEVRGEVVRVVRQVYGMAYAQLGMVALVTALGVLTALLISVIQRTRELGLLRAVGANRFQVLHSVLAEAVLMGAIGTFIGAIMGVAIQWYVVQVILLEEAGFAFPVVLPWKEAGIIAGLSVLVATLAGLLPAVQAGRLRIAEAIAYE